MAGTRPAPHHRTSVAFPFRAERSGGRVKELFDQRLPGTRGVPGRLCASAMVVDQLFSREAMAHWLAAGGPSAMPEVALAG